MSPYHVLGAFSVIVKLQTLCPALVTSPLVSEVIVSIITQLVLCWDGTVASAVRADGLLSVTSC